MDGGYAIKIYNFVAGEKIGVIRLKETVINSTEYIDLAVGYGLLIVGTRSSGEMKVYAIYGSKVVQLIAGSGNSYSVQKTNEYTIRITNVSEKSLMTFCSYIVSYTM